MRRVELDELHIAANRIGLPGSVGQGSAGWSGSWTVFYAGGGKAARAKRQRRRLPALSGGDEGARGGGQEVEGGKGGNWES